MVDGILQYYSQEITSTVYSLVDINSKLNYCYSHFSAKSSSSSGSDSESDARSDTSKKKEAPRSTRKTSSEHSDDSQKRVEPKKTETRRSTDSAESAKKKDTYSEPEEGQRSYFTSTLARAARLHALFRCLVKKNQEKRSHWLTEKLLTFLNIYYA